MMVIEIIYQSALPLLEKYNMKATFFISAVCTEEMKIRALWTDIISCLTFFHKTQIIELGNKKFKNFIEVESKIALGEYLSTCEISVLSENLNYLISKYNVEKEIQTLPDEIWIASQQKRIKRALCLQDS